MTQRTANPRIARHRIALGIAILIPMSAAPTPVYAQGGSAPAAVWTNFDFVPGEKVLFAEDFSRDRVGNFPQRLELIRGNAEVAQWSGKTWLRFTSPTQFRVNLPQALPQRYTVEFDLVMTWWGMGFTSEKVPPGDVDEIDTESIGQFAHVIIMGTEAGIIRGSASGGGGSTVDPRTQIEELFPEGAKPNKVVKVRFQNDGKYSKLYLDEKRVANIPNADVGRSDELLFVINEPGSPAGQEGHTGTMITGLSINAGGPELYDALIANGRVATQGIYFDTGSDRIRPESGGTLKQIADMLRAHADLKLLIEGHTDNVGDAATNLALSDKRAAAVKAALVAQHGADGVRLQTKGLGMTKPVSPNTTAEGRQNNRRVELVKQ